MSAVAVLRLVGPRLSVFLSAPAEDLDACGLVPAGDGSWNGPRSALEPVCDVLDRQGFLWGVYDPSGARTFAERLFAECPSELAPVIYGALRPVLADASGDGIVLAALDAAWMDVSASRTDAGFF